MTDQRAPTTEAGTLTAEALSASGQRGYERGYDAATARAEQLDAALDAVGLPREAGVVGLIEHHRNNEAATQGFWKIAADEWKARAERAEAVVAAAREVTRFYGTDRTWSLMFRELLGSRIADLAAAVDALAESERDGDER